MEKTGIQWTDATWNIARGCTKVDEDCKFCYMYRGSLNNTRYKPTDVVRTKGVFNLPLRLKEPHKIFTSSLTDFFHEDIDAYRDDALEIIKKCPQHTFQILTKRPQRIEKLMPLDHWFGNVWMGTSCGSKQSAHRIHQLVYANVACKLKFLSIEPLHGELLINPVHLKRIKWVIVGGESGNENGLYRYRECKLEWIEYIIGQCKAAGVPVFVKQLGTHLSKQLKLKDRHGGDINEWPEHLKIRQFPTC